MDDGALDHALEAGRGLRILPSIGNQVGQFGIDVFDEVAAQEIEIDIAGAHDGGCVLIVDQRQEKMFQWSVFMPALTCEGESSMKRLFKAARKARQGLCVL